MRILVYGISNGKGGISEYMMSISKNLKKENVTFDYIIKGKDSIYENQIRELEGKVIYYNYSNFWSRIKNIYKIIKDERKSHNVFYFNTSGVYFVFPVFFAFIFNYKIITHAHLGMNNKQKLFLRFLNFINRFFVNYVSKCKFICSDLAGDWIFGKKRKDLIFIKNTVDTSKFKYSKRARIIKRKELNIKDYEIAILNTGRLVYQKNQKFILEIAKEFQKQNEKKYKFFIVGDGNDKKSLVNMVKQYELSNVNFLGKRNDISEILSACDVFILPSFYEGFPISCIEAQTSGIECYVSNTITRLVNITGLVEYLPINNINDWVNKIKNVKPKKRDNYYQIVQMKGYDSVNVYEDIYKYLKQLESGDKK